MRIYFAYNQSECKPFLKKNYICINLVKAINKPEVSSKTAINGREMRETFHRVKVCEDIHEALCPEDE